MNKKGLTTFQLKIIGLILMVLDHMYSFLPNMPIQFKWVGRIVAPIFIFMTVEGYYHTRNKKKYMLRLFMGSVVMNIGNLVVPKYFPPANDHMVLTANIFGTLLMITIYLCIVDFIVKAIKNKEILKIVAGIGLFILPVALGLMMIVQIELLVSMPLLRYAIFLIPTPLFIEGGPIFLIVGILMYLFRENRKKQFIVYSLLSLGLMLAGSFTVQGLLYENYQWMMVFAVPLLWRYNGEKGRGMKYLFYIFYPVHMYILYIISTL